MCGIDRLETADGGVLTKLFNGGNDEIHKIAVTEFPWSKSIRKGRYRFVYYPVKMFINDYPEGFGELYDLEADPWEMNNLYFSNEHKGILTEMKDDFLEWLITSTRVKTILPAVTSNIEGYTRLHNRTNADGKINPCNINMIKMRNYI